MKIASWNVNSLNVRLPHVLEWIAANQPDILGLQETKTVDEKFPVAEIEAAGYHVVYAGQKTYNGVAVLSKHEAGDIVTDIPGLDDHQRRVMGVTLGDIRFLNLYVPNGSEVGSDKYDYKLGWLKSLAEYVKTQLAQHPNLIVAGDFNIAPDDRDVYDPEAWREQILCSTPERDALRKITGLGLSDTFRLFDQEEKLFSWWDYRAAGFRRNLGLRIDLILASPAMRERCTACYVDKTPRKWERPSDHAPVVAEFR